MISSRFHFVPFALLGLLVASACGDDGSTDSTTAAATTSGTTGPASTTDTVSTDGTASDGASSSPTSDSGQVATESSGGATTADGTASTTASCEETVGPKDGIAVASCEECRAEPLCMVLTEHGGPADGGGPMVSTFCFPIPMCCDAAFDCDCAGHLCPEKVVGGASSCETLDGVLHCEVAYP